MRMTPLDVRKQDFRKVLRGFDTDEVHAFLETVADELESVLDDNKQLREQVIDLDEKVEEYRNLERSLRDTLLTAERVMSEARQNARKEAELILREAVSKAQEQAGEMSAKVESLKSELRELRADRDAFLERLDSLARAEMQRVDLYRREFEKDEAQSQLSESHEGQLEGSHEGQSSSARELWRDYSRAHVAGRKSGQPVDTGVELLEGSEAPSRGTGDRGGWFDTGHSPPEVDRITRAMDDMSRGHPKVGAPSDEGTADEDEPGDPGDPGGGHDGETVATFAGPQSRESQDPAPVDGAVDEERVFENRSKELPERVEDSGGGRWSLSRFTRGLGNF